MAGAAGAAGGSKTPPTIYEMLLWLYGLKDKQTEREKLEEYIGTTLTQKSSSVSTAITKITEETNKLVQQVCKDAGKIIVGIENGTDYSKQKTELDKELEKLKKEAEWKTFDYPSEGKKLYDQFLRCVYCCLWQLQFLYKRCYTKSAVGGWAGCRYDQGGPDNSDKCKDDRQRKNHEQRCPQCSSTYKGCLKTFLTDGSEKKRKKAPETDIYNGATYSGQCPQDTKGSKRSVTPSCAVPPMGFPKNKLPPPGNKQGSGLHLALNSYFKDHYKPFPKLLGLLKLLELLQASKRQGSSSATINAPESWIAGDFWAFFFQLNRNTNLKNNLKSEIQKNYENGFMKRHSKAEKAEFPNLDDAFNKLLFATHGNNNNHPSSLLSLSECDGSVGRTKQNSFNHCGKHLYGVFSDPFYWVLHWFNDNGTIKLLTFPVLQTLAIGLKSKLMAFKQGLETSHKSKNCVKNESCQCIVWCDDTHSVLYRRGFTFYSPTSLAVKGSDGVTNDSNRTEAQKRKCKDLTDQLENVIGTNGALTDFIGLVAFTQPPPKPRSDSTQNGVQPTPPAAAPTPPSPKPAAAKPKAPAAKGTAAEAATAASKEKGAADTDNEKSQVTKPPAAGAAPGSGEPGGETGAEASANEPPTGAKPGPAFKPGDKGAASGEAGQKGTQAGDTASGPHPPAANVVAPVSSGPTGQQASGPVPPRDPGGADQGAQGTPSPPAKGAEGSVGGERPGAGGTGAVGPAPTAPPATPPQTGLPPPDSKKNSITSQKVGGGPARSDDTSSATLKVSPGEKLAVQVSSPSNGQALQQRQDAQQALQQSQAPAQQPASQIPPVAVSGRSGGNSGPTSTPSTTTTLTSATTGSSTGSTTSLQSTGTVQIADNNRDGIGWKNVFGTVLIQLRTVVSAVSNIATKTSSLILTEIIAHHSSLLEPPCNVKECLEWLDRVCTNGNKDCKCQSVHNANSCKTHQCKNCNAQHLSEAVHALLPGLRDYKLRGSNNIVQGVVSGASALFNALKGPNYQPAYRLTARWPVCGPATSAAANGVQCRGCQDTNCQCSTTSKSGACSSCDGSCCHRCEVRLCAGIFIAMVPALHRALDDLKKRLKENHGQAITAESVKGYFTTLGYGGKDLTDKKCTDVDSKLGISLPYLRNIKDNISNAFLGKNLRGRNSTSLCYFQAANGAKSASFPNASTVTCSTPTSIREMLLWLMGLPYCQGYEGFVDTLQKKYEEHNKTLLGINSSNAKTGASSAQYYLHRQFSFVIFQLPVLFFTVEADVSYLQDVFCQFAPEHNRERLKKILNDDKKDCNNKIGAFEYPCAGDKLCAMFYDYTYKVHLQLRFLLTMCNTEQSDGGWKHCRFAAGSAATRAVSTEAQDCCSKDNLLCTCTSQRKSKLPTTSTNCQRLLREFLRDCQNKDPVTGNIFQAACSNLYVSMGFRVPLCSHETDASCSLICHYTGDNIKAVLSVLVDESKGPSRIGHDGKLSRPLSVVTQWMIGLQGQEPRSLGDILDLFRELCVGSNRTNASASALQIGVRNGQERNNTMASVLSEQLGALLEDENAYYFSRTVMTTGADTAKKEVSKIQVALYNVLDVWHHRNTTGPRTQGSDPNVNSLIAIMGGCASDRSKTCTAYIKSLSHGLYKYYAPEFQCQQNGAKKISCDHVLDWLFKWCKALYKKLKDLKEKIVKCCSCCLEASKKKDADCTSIVSCCHCLPELYKCALVFGDPKALNGDGRYKTLKKCSDFMDTVSAVLSTYAPLFKACEGIMSTVYAVLFMASRNKVYEYFKDKTRREHFWTSKVELIEAFRKYVERAMQCSKKKLMETFLKPLCEEYKYQGCDDQCHKKDDEVSVSPQPVTTITAVIPQYCPPVIDPYHYKAFKKKSDTQAEGSQAGTPSGHYSFKDAIDFHVKGANCILPVPSNLRSAVDWILRVTVGEVNKNSSNGNISRLSGEVQRVFTTAGVSKDDVNVPSYVTDLVTGLRKFVGYEDRSENVKTSVTTVLGDENKGVKGALKEKIDAIDKYLNGEDQFGTEMGKALLKGRYRKNGKGEEKDFMKLVEELKQNLTEKHIGCKDLKCHEFNKLSNSSSPSNVNTEGLKQLHDFLNALKDFAELWNTIGRNNEEQIVHDKKNEAVTEISTKIGGPSGSQTNNAEYFTKLHQALAELGNCADKVTDLDKNGNGVTTSADYRGKIITLIDELKKFGQHIKGCDFMKDEKDTKKTNNEADPVYAVKSTEELIKLTTSKVEQGITEKLKETAELSYTLYITDEHMLKIGTLIFSMKKHIPQKLDRYKSHLDDLKQLCQWLYRMGQLYNAGVKGFVESLISHLQYILRVIGWIEFIKIDVELLNGMKFASHSEMKDYLSPICNLIPKVLNSYVLEELPNGNGQNDRQELDRLRQLLHNLRLLALDRYTLQVWGDNKGAIKDWITFEGGIVRNSDLGEIKRKLHELTGIAYSSNTAQSSTPRNRIHNFHAICVIQKFSYEAPITRLERSLEKLEGIKDKLNEVKRECDGGIQDVSSDGVVTSFCDSVSQFLEEPYGVYSFAKFVHTILGPNIFSAVIAGLEELKDSDKLSGSEAKKKKFCGIVTTMCEGLASDTENKNHYKLGTICDKLESFLDTLKREYIFCYPVVCGIESDRDCKAVCPGEPKKECDTECSTQSKDASLACSSQSSVTPSLTSATSTVSLTSPMPPLCAHCHTTASICQECIPLLARIFITLVPVLYPQLCYLAYQSRLYWQQDQMNGYKDSALSSLLRTFGWPTECLNRDVYIDVRFIGHHVYWLLSTEENSLRLLCQEFSTLSQQSPFNEDSPLHRLYNKCLAYYQRRRSQSLTDSKSITPVMPKTLRQIMRFFVYLPFSTQFDALQCAMQGYCNQSRVVNFSDLFATLMMSSAMSAVLLQLIECPQGAFLRFFDDIYTNTEGFYLDNNTETLFYQLCDLSVTLYRGLKFLSLQCGTGASLAGWKDCRLRGVKRNKEREDTGALDTQQLQLCASHLCECQSIGAKDSSTTAPMCLTEASTVSTAAMTLTTTCSLPLLRYLTDADCFFSTTLTVPNALRKVCLNDSCQEMIYRNMAPRGWQKEVVQCAHRDEHSRDTQLEVCDQKACCSACQHRDSDPQRCDFSKCCDPSNCRVCCCHPCCRTQCSRVMCSTLYGHHLFHLLRNFVGHQFDADPLLQFTRYMVVIAAWPPDSVSGYMTFMLRFSDQLRKEERDTQGSVSVSASLPHGNTSQKNGVNTSVLSGLRSEISLCPGEFDPQCLIGAFLRVTHCEHNNGAAHTASASALASPSSGDASLSSQCPTSTGVAISVLRDCKDCNYYNSIIYPLDYDVYDLYLPIYARRYLTWMLHFGPRLHGGMRALEKEFRRHIRESSVSQSGVSATDPGASGSAASQSRTSVQCHSSIVQCPFALPELHAAGLHFWDPEKMCNEKNKISCPYLVQRLRCTLQDSSPLADFLHQCDSFLWSVRKPFYWLTMALWIVATVYLLFVHLWRLDSWRLLSHGIRSRASHLVYPKVLLSAELDHSYERYYAPR